jgi:hypothetical protein
VLDRKGIIALAERTGMKEESIMEYYRNEIQITFSPPELEVVRRAVDKFCHFDTPETYSAIPFPEINATRILNKSRNDFDNGT